MPDGAARRLIALRLKDGAEREFAAITADEAKRSVMSVSVLMDNSFAPRWFDGETLTGLETPFTHLWEQGFTTMESATSYEPQWQTKADGLIELSLELLYTLEAGAGYNNPL